MDKHLVGALCNNYKTISVHKFSFIFYFLAKIYIQLIQVTCCETDKHTCNSFRKADLVASLVKDAGYTLSITPGIELQSNHLLDIYEQVNM